MSAEIGVGTVVVCIDTDWSAAEVWERKPYLNEVLTVREAFDPTHPNYNGMIYLRFVEIVNPPAPGRVNSPWPDCAEQAFRSDLFRPVRKTDISVFTELLVTPPLDFEIIIP